MNDPGVSLWPLHVWPLLFKVSDSGPDPTGAKRGSAPQHKQLFHLHLQQIKHLQTQKYGFVYFYYQ